MFYFIKKPANNKKICLYKAAKDRRENVLCITFFLIYWKLFAAENSKNFSHLQTKQIILEI